MRFSSIQRYRKKLSKRNELTGDVFKMIQQQYAKLARTHGIPEFHNTFNTTLTFHHVSDKTGKTHYSVGKYLLLHFNIHTYNMLKVLLMQLKKLTKLYLMLITLTNTFFYH